MCVRACVRVCLCVIITLGAGVCCDSVLLREIAALVKNFLEVFTIKALTQFILLTSSHKGLTDPRFSR